MLKKIDSSLLRPGMYIQELCGSWLENPFWKKSFLLEDVVAIRKIIESQVQEVWIDTGKGLDIAIIDSKDEVEVEVIEEAVASAIEETTTLRYTVRVSMDDELSRAAKIVDRSREAVVSMFAEARMGKAVDATNAAPLVEEIALSVMRNPGALIGLARLKTADDYTYMHSVAVCALMISLATQLGLDDKDIHACGIAGLLHDIGKMAIPHSILNKPGKLTDDEFVTVQTHPEAGYQMLLSASDVGAIALDVCRHHHEKIDGTGYPDRLSGEQISLHARMGAVCDVYDAITSNRPYKRGWCPSESIRKMAEWCHGHFDERVFQAFVRSIGIYPVGTLVRLTSGKLGVVVEQQIGKSLLSPKVRVFFSTKSSAYIKPELIDLAADGIQDKIASHELASTWGLKDIDRYWLGDEFSAA